MLWKSVGNGLHDIFGLVDPSWLHTELRQWVKCPTLSVD